MSSTDTTTEAKPVETKPVETKPVETTTTTEAKPVETPVETKPAESESLIDAPAAEATPIEYKDFTVPEGFELDVEALTPAKELFAKYKLDQAGAQELINMFVENAIAIGKATEESATELWNETRSTWTKEIETDADIGGAKLPEVRAGISKLIDKYGTPGLRDALKLTGADNNPAVVKFLHKAATLLNEGKHLTGDPAPAGPKTLAQRMYPQGINSGLMGRPTESPEAT